MKWKRRTWATVKVLFCILLVLYIKGLEALVEDHIQATYSDMMILAESQSKVAKAYKLTNEHLVASLDVQDAILVQHREHIENLEEAMSEVVDYLNTKL